MINHEDRKAWMDRAMKIMTTAMKLKKKMIERGLRDAKCKCPLCSNDTFRARLCGPKNHMHAACQTTGCDAQIME